MICVIDKDILTVDRGIVAHQVNCVGAMGAGLAKHIRKKWPEVWNVYRAEYTNFHLGSTQFVQISRDLYVANLFGQRRIGRGLQTHYPALADAMIKLKVFAEGADLPVYLPYQIGCGLGGGDWGIVSKQIELILPDCIVCKLDGA